MLHKSQKHLQMSVLKCFRGLFGVTRKLNYCIYYPKLNYYGVFQVFRMSQRPITSFFTVTSKKPSDGDVKSKPTSDTEDSPVKVSKRRSRAQIASESEEEGSPQKAATPQKESEKKIESENEEKENVVKSELDENETARSATKDETTKNSKRGTKSKRKKSESDSSDLENGEKQVAAASPQRKRSKTTLSPQPGDKETTGKAKRNPKSEEAKSKTPNSKTESDAKSKRAAASRSRSSSPAEKSPRKSPDKESKSVKKKSPSPAAAAKDKKSAKKKSSPKEEKKKSPKEEKKEEAKSNVGSLTGSSVKGAEYNPHKSNYHPIDDASWKHGEKVPYLALCRTLQEIEGISARLKIIEILANYYRSVIVLSPQDLLASVYLCLNKLAPAYEAVELGVAETNLMKAISQCTGRTLAQLKADAQSVGDLGLVAERSRSNQRIMFQPAPLSVATVFEKLKEICQMTGHASVSRKIDKIQSLFVACRLCEARYLIRSLAGKLRIGLAEQSVLQALAQACALTPPGQSYPPSVLNRSKGHSSEDFKSTIDKEALILKTTYCECPNYNRIIPVLLEHGVHALPDHCKLSPGIPLRPMLAHPTKGIHEVLKRFDNVEFTCEWKYDGERAQIHYTDGGKNVSIFSRNQEDNTSKYPDIISNLKSALGPNVESCILDTEAVAWDRVNKKILPFQILSTRKRKDAVESDITVQVCVFMFDLLYLNGQPLVREPFSKRRELLKEHFQHQEGQFVFATSMDTTDMDRVQEFLEESVKGNCEGLMVKTLNKDATYEIAKRSHNWLKLKKDYLEGVGDTLDVVVLGGYLGRGKRTGLYGGFLLACYDPENEQYQSLCKIGTGFTDEDLTQHSEHFKPHIIPQARSYYLCDSSLTPDHWFDATTVWEIKCADLSLSPVHKAAVGIVDPEKGISLRFPRFLRIRDDKAVEDATSARQIADMYESQDQIMNQQSTTSKFNEEDFY
uniref:DNA ligase n=1 Tax=Cacopsylla melanoneura TaxID=428564 RepID=A0A8D8VAD7_9HEMI